MEQEHPDPNVGPHSPAADDPSLTANDATTPAVIDDRQATQRAEEEQQG